MNGLTVLKLDSSFKPLEVITWQEAFILTYVGKAWAVEYTEKWVSSAREKFKVPSIIALYQFIDGNYFTLPCTRKNVIIRDDKICQYCDGKFSDQELTVDHVVPRSKGGKTVWDNVVTACSTCNQKKSNYRLEDTPFTLKRFPRKPTYRSIIKNRFKNHNLAWARYL
ncbi:MAG: HNH endonuclease [Parcubacteria group bacterium]|nr:HNH endonuclease [Parcubacteria group bacterium]|tara:strand:- start:2010 stop:2510 length:501 start_codon:yes stop_codon:yes gene_type:complete